MEAIVCGGGVLLIVVLIVFFYLLNTARKRVTETTSLGKKQLLPVYISLADKPTSIIQGMNKLNGTRDILYTLRDDLRPDSTYLGHLDLTGSLLPTKVARSANDAQGRTTEYFRDEWLALKAKLYDGSILRVSGIQKSKKRKSYWKRSRISGKMKSKPEKFKGTAHDLKVRIVPNPEVYKIAKTSNEFKQGLNIGKFTISQLSTEGGMVSFVANSPFEEVEHENILQILKSAYTLLQRKAA